MVPDAAAPSAAQPDADSLRERKKRQTRRALRRAALSLVKTRGLASVTVEDIAAAANVSPRTFFNYFTTKEDAISGWDPAVRAEIVQRLRARPADESAPQALRAALLEVLSPFDVDHRNLLDMLTVTRSDPHLIAHNVARWEEGQRELIAALAERRGTDPTGDSYAALVVATMLAAGRVALMSWCEQEGRVPLAQLLASSLDVLQRGLAEPGERVAEKGRPL